MNMETNKIFAALLVAGIIAMLGGFISSLAMHPHELEEAAYEIEAAEDGAGGGHEASPAETGPESITDLMASADIERGKKLSRACMTCHTMDQGGESRQGPPLWGVAGRSVASIGGFAYSDAMKSFGGKWDVENLNHFLWNPKKTVSGTKMNYRGVKKPEDRAALVAFLKSLK
ncbi:MAG: cytochrome c family protein [Alphaproteobacteria bacterium]|nr:MAG: cytochrome c family protein [Alphaproteobacteria bacterium]